ncbi:MAG: hypothetical protein QOE23_949 [Pseudonocardiales bacterium]|jgi:hypothetical protein|nr:hypothetical protein [Pseudonocardiales bacterium]
MQPNYGPPPPQRAPLQWHPLPPVQPVREAPGRGLAITAVVLSAVALLGVLVTAVWVLVATTPADDGGTSTGPLTGQLSASPGGGPVTGDTLARAVIDRITQDGGEVSRMDCPETPKAGQGVVTVCHGVISSSDWAVIVYFEDKDGHFTLEPL